MTHVNDHPLPTTPDVTGKVVARPRPTDALGSALACAFGTGPTIPADLLMMLAKLDRVQ